MRSAWLVLLPACAGPPTDPGAVAPPDAPVAACPWDDDGPAAPAALVDAAQGWLCPAGDHDWFVLEAEDVLTVTLSLPAEAAPLALTWAAWTLDGALVTAPLPGEAATPGHPLRLSHAVPPGPLRLQVRDLVDGASDEVHPYTLAAHTGPDPDPQEPNDHAPTAGPGAWEGALATRGDVDRFVVQAGPGELLDLHLEAAVGEVQPVLSVHGPDGAAAWEAPVTTPDGVRVTLPVPGPGPWEVRVADDDGLDHAPDATYALSVAVRPDPDPHEPNDHPTVATALGEAPCLDAWVSTAAEAALAGAGDVDWYRLDLTGCDRGIVDAELTLDGPAADLDVELRLLRSHPRTRCARDQDCAALAAPCDGPSDCELLGQVCLPSGQCAGAGTCLPDLTCAATTLQVVGARGDATTALSAPLVQTDTAWLAVSDHRGDTTTPDAAYTLDLRVRAEPDPLEPNDVYTAGPPTGADARLHAARAVPIPVHDCAAGDCCDETTWVEGVLATAWDQDWLRYEHPCPGQDCMVRVRWRMDAGPVDHFLQVFQGTSLWFDQLAGTAERPWHDARAGAFGGLAPTDACFYAWQGHAGAYHLAVRDTIWVSSADPRGGRWDHDDAQTYGVCVEKLADGCASPCRLLAHGCAP